jgi:hypothetical protein
VLAITVLVVLTVYLSNFRIDVTPRSIPKTFADSLAKDNFSLFYDDFYRHKYDRDPPPKYNDWIAYAKRKGCSLDLDDYERINLDLEPFRKQGITQKMIKKGLMLSHMFLVRIEKG